MPTEQRTDRGVIASTHVVAPTATVHASATPHAEGYEVRVEVNEPQGNRQITILALAQAKALHDSLGHVLLAAEIRAAEAVAS